MVVILSPLSPLTIAFFLTIIVVVGLSDNPSPYVDFYVKCALGLVFLCMFGSARNFLLD